jgi:hypothetical protein
MYLSVMLTRANTAWPLDIRLCSNKSVAVSAVSIPTHRPGRDPTRSALHHYRAGPFPYSALIARVATQPETRCAIIAQGHFRFLLQIALLMQRLHEMARLG